MVDLLTAIGDFFAGIGKWFFESRINRAVYDIRNTHGASNLELYWGAIGADERADPRVIAAHEDAIKRVAKEKDLGVFGAIPQALVDGFGALEPQIEAGILAALNPVFGTNATTITELFAGMTSGVMTSIVCAGLDTSNPDQKAIIDDVIEKLRPVIVAGVTFTVASLIADQIHPVKNPGLQTAMRSLQDVVGYQSLATSYSAPIHKATIGVPIERAINQILRPYVPDLGILAEMTRGHHLTEDKYATAIARHGIMQPYADTMVEEVWTQPGLRNLLIISQYARPDPTPDEEGREFLQQGGLSQYIGADWYLAEKLAKSGYKNRDIAFLLKALKERTIGSIVANIYSIRKAQFSAGKIDRTEYENFLKGRGFSADEVREALDAITDDLQATENNQLAALWEKKYLNGRATEADLRTALKSLDKKDLYIDTRVKLLTEQKLGKLTAIADSKVLSRSDYEKQYAAGKITKTQLVNLLDVAGWSLSDATAIADLQDLDAVNDVRAETIRAAEEQAKNNRLSLTDLESVYQNNGKSKLWAHARRDYIEQTILGKLEVTTTTAPADTLKAEQAERIRAAEQEAKNERLSKDELIAVYLANGKTQAWADARANYIEELIIGKASTSGGE